jgi:signal transduction histidine kinase
VIAFRVSDTGIGIPTDKLTSIFDPFVQINTRLTRTEEGIGLGLAISRDLARGMGGELTVESREGVGSTFTLTLPRG